MVALAACTVGFALIAGLVLTGMTDAPDRWLLLALRTQGSPAGPVGPGWLAEFFSDFTNVGGRSVLAVFGVLATGYLAMLRRWRALAFLAAALVGGMVLGDAIKALVARPRPEIVPHLVEETSSSFPSGHSTLSAAAYIAFAMVLSRPSPGAAARLYLAGAAAIIVLLVGVSRVFLGIHYPSDVLAGWCLGAAWTLACRLVTDRVGGR